MSKFCALLALPLILAPGPAVMAQDSGISLGGSLGYYRASLDHIDEDFEAAQANGAEVVNTNGGMIAGGFMSYRVSPYFSWRLSVAVWKDHASGSATDVGGELEIIHEVKLTPLLLGGQFFLLPPESHFRPYVGGSAGMVLIRNVITVNVNPIDELATSSATAATGSDFMAFPYLGLQVRIRGGFSLYGEGGYRFADYVVVDRDITTGDTTRSKVSLNGVTFSFGAMIDL